MTVWAPGAQLELEPESEAEPKSGLRMDSELELQMCWRDCRARRQLLLSQLACR